MTFEELKDEVECIEALRLTHGMLGRDIDVRIKDASIGDEEKGVGSVSFYPTSKNPKIVISN